MDDSLRHQAERGRLESLARATAAYQAAEQTLKRAAERARTDSPTALTPPEYVLAAWAARDRAWGELLSLESVNEELRELAVEAA